MTNIVMLVRDRYRLTNQSIWSLYKNSGTENNQYEFNLTIVDDGSADFRVINLLSLLPTWHDNATVISVNNSDHVLSKLKNLGVAWSQSRFGRGDFLCLCDNDVYFKPEWLGRMVKCALLEGYDFRIFGGQAHPFHKPLGVVGWGTTYHFATEYDCLAGTHWFMPWSTWDEFGPLDPNTAPGVCQSEDWQFTEKIRKAGGRIGVTQPHCVIDCSLTQTDGKEAPGADQKMLLAKSYPEVVFD